jgi:hypothetical protein
VVEITTSEIDSPQPLPLTQAQVLTALIRGRGGRRAFVPISRSFLQQRQPGGGAAPLSKFVNTRRKRALDLWLLAHTLASTPPWDVGLPSWVWATAIGMPDNPAARVFISKTWTWLEQLRLIRSERDGALRRVYLLDDAGTGSPYAHGGDNPQFDYLKLPHRYWLDGWSAKLDLAGTAVLLIALALPKTFILPQEHAGRWYGISRDTVRRGLHELIANDLLSVQITYKRAPLSPTGATEQRRYALLDPFRRRALTSQD